MQASINQLYEWTGRDRRTIKKRLEQIRPDSDARYDSATALEAIYFDTTDENGGKISSAEALRRLTIAREQEIALDMEIKRKERISIDIVTTLFDETQQATAAILKSKKGKRLDEPVINEILEKLREMPAQLPSAIAAG